MDFIWIIFAFVCGFVVRLIHLPPLLGFLFAGFLLNFLGVVPAPFLQHLADLGITLMLFSIGLKIHLNDLFKREVWASTFAHTALWIVVGFGLILVLSVIGLSYFSALTVASAALIAFALSFSSTVCVVKLLEESNELKTRHGQLALGILVMQDVIAVIFLVFATGAIPSIWALALFALIPARKILFTLLEKAGHGELLPLLGLFLALGGYELFYLVGVKGDLGALIMGMLLSTHPKGAELNKSLLNFKDLFLIGFFLSIGFTALPTVEMFALSMILALLIPAKALLFYVVLVKRRLRARTSFLTSMVMSNYSEFGLIVVALSVQNGWLSKEWLVVLALAMSLSFIITSVVYRQSHQYFARFKNKLITYEHPEPLVVDRVIQPKGAEILVVGLGRVGKSAFDALSERQGNLIAGIDADHFAIAKMREAGKNVFFGDAEDLELWEKLDIRSVKLILVALPIVEDCLRINELLIKTGYSGQFAAIARYQDERDTMLEAGIANVFNFYAEAGVGFADDSLALIGNESTLESSI